MYTVCETDSSWEAAAGHRERSLVRCGGLEGGLRGQGGHTYLELIYVVHQTPA